MTNRALITKVQIKADAQGNAPSQIELLRTGKWQTPWHGDFEITTADLHEFAANFAKGIGLVAGDKKAPINYAHESWEKAAAWIPRLIVSEDGQALLADGIEWTPAAVRALKDGEWRYISPEFNPRGCPWEDPEGTEDPEGLPEFVNNVLSGAALTNIPLFKKLKPIMASRVSSKSKTQKADVTSGDGKNHNQGEPMKLEDILAKQVSERSDEEKAFLSDNAANLTDEQKTQVETEATDADAKATADKEAADKAAADAKAKEEADQKAADEASKLEASRKGQTTISASELASLKASAARADALAAEIDTNKATATVKASSKAGQIKSGEENSWIGFLTGLSADHRGKAEALLAGLPKNDSIGKELGGEGLEASAGAAEELHGKVAQKIKASAAEGKTMSYYDAEQEILTADTALATRIKEERTK